jgi:lantibiotic transport system permease protein
MIAHVLAAEFIKIKRKAIWFLVFLGPLGVIALQAANFGLRYDYFVSQYQAELWDALLQNIHYLGVPATLFGITVLTSMIAGIEHQMNSWKQVLALPVSRFSIYTAKFILNTFLLLVSCSLLAMGSIGLGIALRFGTDFSLADVLQISFYPFFAGLPILALQLWLSITMKNQAIPLTVGIVGTIVSLFAAMLPDWVIWKWPLLINSANIPEYSVIAGVSLGILLLACSTFDFIRRDVK